MYGLVTKRIRPSPGSPPCSVDGCTSLSRSRGLCSMHYQRVLNGVPFSLPTRTVTYGPVETRFWSHVDKTETCWLWTGGLGRGGYGQFGSGEIGGTRLAHRVGYELQVGPIPEGLELDHLCRVRHCVRGSHLEPVTGRENLKRSPITNGNKTHCLNDHPLSGDNLFYLQGKRQCRTCQRIRRRASAVAKRATGLCSSCEARPAAPERRTCQRCLDRLRTKYHAAK